MRVIERRGRTVEEATERALRDLGVGREMARVTVLEHPSSGLFGLIGQREALVRVEVDADKASFVEGFLRRVVDSIGLEARVEVRETAEAVEVSISGPEVGLLIGRRGQTLEAMQYLANVAAGRVSGESKPVIVDVEGYRERRKQALERLAERMAEKARRLGRRVVLEPMPAQERRVVHLAVERLQGVKSESVGDEPRRKVVIVPVRE